MACECGNPFCTGAREFNGRTIHPQHCDGASRLDAVKRMDADQLRAVQVAVRQRAESRLRRMAA